MLKKHIEINIWKACNNKCRFCMSALVWEDEKQLTKFELIKNEIVKYSKNWYNSIWFLGWDISIHPDIYKIIKESKINWFKYINIITNWMIFSDYEKAENIVNSWVTRINISVHSHIQEVEDYLTQISWWLKKKLKSIDNFNLIYNKWLLKSNLSINIVVNWINYKEILKTCIYFYKVKNIKDIRINFLRNRYFFTEKDKNDLELSYNDFIPYLKALIKYSINSDLRITFDSVPFCIFHKLGFLNPNLIIENFLWENFDNINEISNINMKDTFIWKEHKKNDLKKKFDICNNCLYFSKCEWVWNEYIDKYWEEEFINIK